MNPDRDKLEMLASDFMERFRRGENPSIDEYAKANPDLADEILEVFPTILATEELKKKKAQTVSLPDNAKNNSVGGIKNSSLVFTLSEGMQLGKYKLQKCIGQGGLGTVWLSRHPDLNLPVAIKILHPDIYEQNDERIRRFLREAQTAARLNHKHIVRVYDAGAEHNLRYLVMEYLERGSVAKLLKEANGPLPVSRACEIATAVADALVTVEEMGIVHRDIKPDNILLDEKGVTKLADLGLVSSASTDDQIKMTTTGTGFGTPLYVSPEQAMGSSKVDIRSDIYSLGCTLYHMATGAPPFNGPTPYQVIHDHIKTPLKDPQMQNPAISEALANVIRKMTAKNPIDRYQTAADLKADLEQASASIKHFQSVATIKAGLEQTSGSASRPAATVKIGLGQTSAVTRPLPQAPQKTKAPTVRLRWIFVFLVFCLAIVFIAIGLIWFFLPPPHNIISRGPLTAPSAQNGMIKPMDWQKLDVPITHGVFPIPLTDSDYEFKNGLLRLFKNANRHPIELFYGSATIIDGDFSLSIEGKNIAECCIVNPPRDFERCRILLYSRDSSPFAKHNSPWQKIEIKRKNGKIACTVNGHDAFAIQGPQDNVGRFFIGFPPGVTGELRKFKLLQNGNDASTRLEPRGRSENWNQVPNRFPPPQDMMDRRPGFR